MTRAGLTGSGFIRLTTSRQTCVLEVVKPALGVSAHVPT
jgi:hypothetical protein